ncbi:MAG: hypothetical protein ACXQT3_03140 [Methermicoccaceae archaeon]
MESIGRAYKYVAMLVVLTLVNALLAHFSVSIGFVCAGSSKLYMAAGFMIVFALWFGAWGALAAYFGCFIGAGLLGGVPPDVSIYWSLADLWMVLIPLAAFRTLDGDVSLHTARDAMAFLVFGVVLNNAVGAAWGASTLAIGGVLTWSQAYGVFAEWLAGNVLLTVVVAPLLLYLGTSYVRRANLYVRRYWS